MAMESKKTTRLLDTLFLIVKIELKRNVKRATKMLSKKHDRSEFSTLTAKMQLKIVVFLQGVLGSP